jgi:light-regulated signal transduction histidine kinase (bacteriophytochrome)
VLLSHVLQNLVGNAMKFRSITSPMIAIEAKQVGHEISISVTDNGIGIEPRFADKIFEMFYRLHDDDEYDGTGIGLTICRKIINDHGGQIWLDTGHNGGTRFVFTTLAAADSDVPVQQSPAPFRFASAPDPIIRRAVITASRSDTTST